MRTTLGTFEDRFDPQVEVIHGDVGWYLVATDDRIIPPPAQRAMADRAGCTVSEVAASHSVYVSQPGATADLTKQAAQAPALS